MAARPELDELLLPGISRTLRRLESKLMALQDLLNTNTADVATLTGLVSRVVTAIQAGGGASGVTQAQLDQLTAANTALESANATLTAALVPVVPPTAARAAFGGLPQTRG